MTEQELSAGISVKPYYGTEKPIPGASTPITERVINFKLEPATITKPQERPPETIPGYENFNAPKAEKLEIPSLPILKEKALIVDTETTGLDPGQDRLICIGAKSVESTDDAVEFFAEGGEKQIVMEFIQYFSSKGYNMIIGMNPSFDMAFILRKCMRYGIPAKELFNAHWFDLQDVLRKGKEEFVPSANKPTKLNTLLTQFFGTKEPMTDEEALKLVAKGDDTGFYKIVIYHTFGTWKLYRLYEHVVENSFSVSAPVFTPGVGDKNIVGTKLQCKTCLAERIVTPEEKGWICDICGTYNEVQ